MLNHAHTYPTGIHYIIIIKGAYSLQVQTSVAKFQCFVKHWAVLD